MPGHDIMVVGASAGGVEALLTITRTLPPNLAAAVFMVLHIPAQNPSLLPNILQRNSALAVAHATDGVTIEHGHIYVAPPDYHMLVEQGKLRVVRGPKENRHRPAIDPLFRSAALAYGPRLVGVVLTGSLDDGTAGLLAVKRRGGIAVVQDPHEALYPSMPLSALANVEADYTLPLASIGPLLERLPHEPTKEEEDYPMPEDMEKERKQAEMDTAIMHNDEHMGVPSAFSCPECGGVLWEIPDGDLLRFRCRVGHALSVESVLAEQSEVLEEALWAALNTLQESVDLSHRMAQRSRHQGQEWIARRFEEKLRDTQQRVALIKQALMKDQSITGPEATKDATAIKKKIIDKHIHSKEGA